MSSLLIVLAVSSVLMLAVAAVVYVLFYRGDSFLGPREIHINSIDWSVLTDQDPPADGPRLEIYHLPVRLALLILAPVGRQGHLPSADQMEPLVEQIVPGLSGVIRGHQPEFSRWPHQLSREGFTKSFFSYIELPGHHGGKGTHWCAIAGRFEADGQTYLAGLVCRAPKENSLGQLTIEHTGKWLDVLRVHSP